MDVNGTRFHLLTSALAALFAPLTDRLAHAASPGAFALDLSPSEVDFQLFGRNDGPGLLTLVPDHAGTGAP